MPNHSARHHNCPQKTKMFLKGYNECLRLDLKSLSIMLLFSILSGKIRTSVQSDQSERVIHAITIATNDAIVYRVARRCNSAFFEGVSSLESFTFSRDRLVFCAEMSDSETSTPAGTSQDTPTRATQWSRKRVKLEQAARMRSRRWKRVPSPTAASSHSETSLPPLQPPLSLLSLPSP